MCSHDRISAYLDLVCSHIRWRPYRERVRRELTDHILTRAEYLHGERGFSEEEAVAQAIRQLGEPEGLGRMLNRAHWPYRRLAFTLFTCAVWAGIVYCVIRILLCLTQ
ncbi:permease prefix domain 1-containing protein [Agathobaculum sp.]|uniref:permease prefix domain 1-containing protein n=1 Tax=Agathobaculum sp. TaxID=2048138 RepID=UPI002A81E3D2|nr:permease prefix domain 1-containing protein [Agathobaculum sp.]MDY3618328.1 permease prefix domain 1-containing protein [Agathobaculum sp.]